MPKAKGVQCSGLSFVIEAEVADDGTDRTMAGTTRCFGCGARLVTPRGTPFADYVRQCREFAETHARCGGSPCS